MKPFTQILCLFICALLSARTLFLPIQAQSETAARSASLAQKQTQLQEELSLVHEDMQTLQEESRQLSRQMEHASVSMQPGYESGKEIACRLQAYKTPTGWQDIFLFLQAVQVYTETQALQDKLSSTQKELEALEVQAETIQKDLEDLDLQQKELAAAFTGLEMLESEADLEHGISAEYVLPPEAGATTQSMPVNLQACLAALDFQGLESSAGFTFPVQSATVSAGTWAYPGGGRHLGLDLASPMFSNVYAAINGIILYAHAPVSSNCGYVGNYCGYPAGGGNTICLLGQVQDKVYAITYAHLSASLMVKAGQQVSAGDIIALSGNSGNSSGPHTHIEVFALSLSLEEAAAYFAAGADFSWGCGFKSENTTSYAGKRIRPESVFF